MWSRDSGRKGVVGSGGVEDLLELTQAVTQLTQRMTTLEVRLETRLVQLTDSAVKEVSQLSVSCTYHHVY